MWRMVLPPRLARAGELVESRLAPPLYRRSRIVTLSRSSRDEITELLGLDGEQVVVASPGVDPRFSPAPDRDGRSPVPLVVSVGRLVPVKRFDVLIESLVALKATVPDLRAVIIGEGYERSALEALRHARGADDWIELPGRLPDDQVIDWYRRAWVVASSSLREGWGMTLTEAGACATPSVATDITGHRDAVVEGQTGFLVDGAEGLTAGLATVIGDPELRNRLGKGALEHSRWFTWDATARITLEALAAEAHRRH
jgi:glycosyltransferase involved in cell wall biosynthesis